MLVSLLLLPLTHLAPTPTEAPLLAAVPEAAYVLVHCRDVAGLHARAERNDWFRLLGSSHGEPLLEELAHEFRREAHSDMDELLAMAEALGGETVFFDTGTVAGFVTEPPANRAVLAGLMRDWMPAGDAALRRTLELAGGAAELVAWPDSIDGWSGRAGHFAAFVDHPEALAIYSGDDSAAVMAVVTESVSSLGSDHTASLVAEYLTNGGGKSGGVEVFFDFTPFVDQAEAVLKEAVAEVLPDPTDLLGLEGGTWLHASADVFPGTRVDGRARLHLPADTLAARLADTFKPLPHTLPADLPKGVWGLYALNWDLKLFYERARRAFEEADRAEGLGVVDAGIEAARGFADIDPIVDVLNQLAGDFAFYFVEPPEGEETTRVRGLEFQLMGLHAGLVDGDAFLTAFEKLVDIGGQSLFDLQEIEGADAYVAFNEPGDVDGGFAFLPRAFAAAPSRRVLELGVRALTRVEGSSLLEGSRMQAAIDENAGACFLFCMEMTPLRVFMLPEMKGDLRLPPLEEGGPARDPFDSQIISSVRRTQDGFEARIHTR